MTNQDTQKSNEVEQRFTEPSEEVKRRNRITGLIITGIILAFVTTAILVRVYGS